MFVRPKRQTQEINFDIPKNTIPTNTTHLMMWLGGRLLTKKRVFSRSKQTYTYQTASNDNFQYVDYVQTLQEECKKMEQKCKACILVYDSKMMKNNEKLELQNIVNNISNCYLVDYEDFANELKQQDITKILTIKR